MSFQKSIDSILDTPKVEGLLIFDLEGIVHFEQVPDNTDQDLLNKLPQRILTMYDIIDENFQECSDFILKYEEKNLYFRKSSDKKGKDFVLAILGEAGINFVSLKLVTNLAMKMMELGDKEVTEKTDSKPRSSLTYRGRKQVTHDQKSVITKKSQSGVTYRGQKL